jgi:hypothetical protein
MFQDAHEVRVDQVKMSRGVGLLISMLVRYPELSRINFNPDAHTLRFSFLVNLFLPNDEFLALKAHIKASIETYHALQDHEPEVFDMTVDAFQDVSVLYVTRDTRTLCQEEITLLVDILKERFSDHLMADLGNMFGEEEIMIQEELIQQMLDDLHESSHEKKLVAFRDGSKVLVFNK